MTANVLEVADLSAGYARRSVLEAISLSIKPGECVGLIGPNGAGKSTLIRCVLGLLRPTAGRIDIAERPLDETPRRELARAVAYVPQASGSGAAMSVFDMVALGRLPYRGLHSAAEERAVIFDAIEQLGLQSLALRPLAELSGGQRQRVLLARALAQQPKLLVLDEPTSDLDLRHQLSALQAVRRVARDQDTAALIAIHDLALAARCCDRLVLLHAGKVDAQGSWQAVLTPENLAHAYGVEARVGSDGGLPYVLIQRELDAYA